jgi:hypothetical protein
MSGFFQDVLRGATEGFFGSPFVRDYAHASKTFTPNSYQNAPKHKFLFHTYFDINKDAWRWENFPLDLERTNFGLLVKEVKLPDFVIDTTTLNQYNRKRVVQTKIKYQPIEITFHDDNANQATKLWEAYYRYYYRDGSIPSGIFSGERGNPNPGDIKYNNRNIYAPGDNIENNWGYIGESKGNSKTKLPFFKNITVFGMNRHNFTAYTLVNPLITQFSHDNYSYSEGSGIMQNKMTVEFETVVYNYGALDGSNPDKLIKGFGSEQNYDRRLSPIATPGANKSILGQGGLIDGVGGTLEALGNGDILGAIKNAGTTYKTFKNVDLKKTAKQELLNNVNSALTNPETTRNLIALIPKVGTTPSPVNTASAPVSTAEQQANVQNLINGLKTAGTQYSATSYPAQIFPPVIREPLSIVGPPAPPNS